MSEVKTIENLEKSTIATFKEDYVYQKDLTEKLDKLKESFTQETINEIVLWKVNRYVKMTDAALNLVNKNGDTDSEIDIELTKEVLRKLLALKGVRIALASTILRFKNPTVYQIIDQRVYRFIHPSGAELKNSTDIEETILMYLEYLDRLKKTCSKFKISFKESDRILYLMDKRFNKEQKLK